VQLLTVCVNCPLAVKPIDTVVPGAIDPFQLSFVIAYSEASFVSKQFHHPVKGTDHRNRSVHALIGAFPAGFVMSMPPVKPSFQLVT
jgi:hypothetical protein